MLPTKQGDHVFGDIMDEIEKSINKVFSSAQGYGVNIQFSDYNCSMPSTIFNGLKNQNFGHEKFAPITVGHPAKAADDISDDHSGEFGVVTSAMHTTFEGVALFMAESNTHAKTKLAKKLKIDLLVSFDNVMNKLVDKTALRRYLGIDLGGGKTHEATSIDDAFAIFNGTPSNKAYSAKYKAIDPVFKNFGALRGEFSRFINFMLSIENNKKKLLVFPYDQCEVAVHRKTSKPQ
jgi:hypothetical protein